MHAAAGRDDRRFSERAARGAQIYRCPGAIAAPRRDRRAVGRWHPTGRVDRRQRAVRRRASSGGRGGAGALGARGNDGAGYLRRDRSSHQQRAVGVGPRRAVEAPRRGRGPDLDRARPRPRYPACPSRGGFRVRRPGGDRAAIQLSLAYKAHWVRVTHTLTRDGIDAESHSALRQALVGTPSAAALQGTLEGAVPGAQLRSWSAEANRGSNPLSLVAGERSPSAALPPGSVVSVTAAYEGPNGALLLGTPVVVGSS